MQVLPRKPRATLRIIVYRFHATGAPAHVAPLFSTSRLPEAIVHEAVQYWSEQDVLEPAGDEQTYIPTARAYDVLNRGSSQRYARVLHSRALLRGRSAVCVSNWSLPLSAVPLLPPSEQGQ